jgi:propanol-preferring alcohol dehydrogenase
MRAMILETIGPLNIGSAPLRLVDLPDPMPAKHEVRIKVSACGVCHTELDEIEGRAPPTRLPMVLGHEVIGHVDRLGDGVTRHGLGDRVGVGWIHHSSGAPDENLSGEFRATGRDANGGYADYMTVPERYAYSIPDTFDDVSAAPLLCAGAVGFRALRLTRLRAGEPLGFTGFGASAHLVLQLARHLYPASPLFVFARDADQRQHALELGADWSGATEATPPEPLAAIIDTTPAWLPVLAALTHLKPGGRLVINAIRKEAADKHLLATLSYRGQLWLEKEIKTVANITHHDIAEFLPLAAQVPLTPKVTRYVLEDANQALLDLKFGGAHGAKVLTMTQPGDPAVPIHVAG